MNRRLGVWAALLGVASACGGVGEFAHPEPGRLVTVFRSIGKEDKAGSTVFAGLAAAPDGTVYLGVATAEGGRILALSPGHKPRVVADGSFYPDTLAVGREGTVYAFDDEEGLFTVEGDGKRRPVPGVPVADLLDETPDPTALDQVVALTTDPATGDVYLADPCKIGRLDAAGTFAIMAGGGSDRECTDGPYRPARGAAAPVSIGFRAIEALAFDPRSGDLLVADSYDVVLRLRHDGVVSPAAGRQGKSGFSGDGGPALRARIRAVGSLAVDPRSGDLFLADALNKRVRRVDSGGTITTVAGDGSRRGPQEGPATEVPLLPARVAVDGQGNLYATSFELEAPVSRLAHRLVTVAPHGAGED